MDPTLAEIRLFAGNYAPLSWALCQGQSMDIASNTPLYALLGTMYGGDGQNTFNLPDLRGRVPVGTGQGPGLPLVDLGDMWGNESVTMTNATMPMHTHMVIGAGTAPITGTYSAAMNVNTVSAESTGSEPKNSFLGVDNSTSGVYAAAPSGTDTLNMNAISVDKSGLSVNVGSITVGAAGQSQPISIMQPFLVLNYIIAIEGIFPSRN